MVALGADNQAELSGSANNEQHNFTRYMLTYPTKLFITGPKGLQDMYMIFLISSQLRMALINLTPRQYVTNNK